MKRSVFLAAVFSLVQLFAGSRAAAQATFIVPQTTTPTHVFTGVSTAQASGCLTNQGQNVQFVFYLATGTNAAPTGVQIRLEGSFNSDAATCATGTWFPISDDGVDLGQNGIGLILGIQSYPFMRLNLVKCVNCDANDTIDAYYTASSAMPGNPFGLYGAGQQVSKVLFIGQSTDATAVSKVIATPYASTAGFILVSSSGAFPNGPSSLNVRCRNLSLSGTEMSFNLSSSGAQIVAIPIPATACSEVDVRYVKAGAGTGNTFAATYIFLPPGGALPYGAQPADTTCCNKEATATNATASVTLTPNNYQRGNVFSVSGRCGAGTAQMLVVDTTTSTNLWTSAATEVGTTTFKFQWNPGLAGVPGDTIQVQLTACGVGNVGTLDVQGSVF